MSFAFGEQFKWDNWINWETNAACY